MMYMATFSLFALHFKFSQLFHHLIQYLCSLGHRPLLVAHDLLFRYKMVNYTTNYIKINKYMQIL